MLRVRLFSCYSYIPFLYNTRPNPLVRGEEGSTAKEQVIDHRVHYRLFNLSLYLAVFLENKPSIQPSNPTCQAALISTSRITTTTENTQRRVCPNSLEIS